jgi:hypothetical protein
VKEISRRRGKEERPGEIPLSKMSQLFLNHSRVNGVGAVVTVMEENKGLKSRAKGTFVLVPVEMLCARVVWDNAGGKRCVVPIE